MKKALWQMRMRLSPLTPKNKLCFHFQIISNRCSWPLPRSSCSWPAPSPGFCGARLVKLTLVPVSRDLPWANDLLSLKKPGSYDPHFRGQPVFSDWLKREQKSPAPWPLGRSTSEVQLTPQSCSWGQAQRPLMNPSPLTHFPSLSSPPSLRGYAEIPP